MQKRSNSLDAGRRTFLKGATLAGAAALTTPSSPTAQTPNAAVPPKPDAKAAPPGPKQMAAETMPPAVDKDPVNQTTSGGDFMVDVLKTLDIDYLAMNCASSFRGLHEAILNHGGNKKPEILTCPHEEIAVHMAQGYAKIEGKPMAMICHGVVGLQHASMALYNAWCDRVPVIAMGGNIMEANKRGPGAEWVHAAVDPAAMLRDFTKWDDQPTTLQHFAESAVRAYKVATTPPMAPVVLSLDGELQENPIEDAESLRIPKLSKVIPPQGDSAALAEAGEDAGRGGKPRPPGRPRGAHAGRHGAPRRTRRDAAMRRARQCRAHELPLAASAQPVFPPLHHRPGRRHRGDGSE